MAGKNIALTDLLTAKNPRLKLQTPRGSILLLESGKKEKKIDKCIMIIFVSVSSPRHSRTVFLYAYYFVAVTMVN
jgi:hypothetical protein